MSKKIDKTNEVHKTNINSDTLFELETYRQGLDAHAIISRTNQSGVIKYVNEKFCEISGYSTNELIGQNHRIINSGIHSGEFFKKIWDTILAGKIWRGEIRNRAKNGRLYWVDTTILPLKHSDGSIDFMSFRYDITASKEAELLYGETQKIAKIGGWELNINTMTSSWTEGTYAIHEIEVGQDIAIENAINFYAPHERERISELVANCIEKGEPFSSDFEFITAKGNKKWVQSKGAPEYNSKGIVVRLVGTFQDITDRKNLEFSMVSQNKELEYAQKIAKLGSWSFEVKSQKITWSRQMYEIFPERYEDGEPSFEKHRSTIHRDDLEMWDKMVAESLQKGVPTRMTFRTHALGDSDKTVWVEAIGHVTTNQEGDVTKLSGTCQNITDKVVKEKELSLILETNKIGLWRFNPATQDLNWDQSMFDLYGVDENTFSGSFEAWEATLHESSRDIVTQEFSEALAGDGHFESMFMIKNTTGEIKYIGARAVIDRDQNGNAIFVTGMNWDRTKEKLAIDEANRQMQIAQHSAKLASIGELAAGVGHEINNPLAIIKGYIETLQDKFEADNNVNPKSVVAYLDKINLATDRIEMIVKGLRTFSRSDQSEELDFDPIEAVKESYNLISEIYLKHGIDFKFEDLTTEKLSFKANRGKFQQILMNLLSNAKDSLRDSNRNKIKLQAKAKNSKLFLSIKDSGVGMSDNVLADIFNPFFTTKEVNQGTGIGLSLVHSFVEEMGGSIDVKTQLGQGSEFVLELPINTSQVTSEPSKKIIKKQVKSDFNLKALVVDDEPEIRSLLAFILELYGVSVVEACNGEEAFKIFVSQQEQFDLIISDMQMPIMSGEKLLTEIRKKNKLRQPKFVFITGGISIDLENQNGELGQPYDGYLFKPFSKSMVLEMLEKCFD